MADRSAITSRARRRARRRRAVALVIAVLVVAGGGSVALAAVDGNSTTPVLATVTGGTVVQTVEASGMIASSVQLSASFATDGTVRVVKVEQGQHVKERQVLARLDTASLQNSLDSATASVASAKQRLATDKTGQTSSVGTTRSGASSTSTGTQLTTSAYSETALTSSTARQAAVLISAPTTTGKANPLTTLINQINAAQTKVITGQTAVDTAKSAVGISQQTLDTAVGHNVTLRDAQTSACADSSSTSSGGTPSDHCTAAQANYEAFADTLTTDMTDLKTKIGTEDDALATLENAVKALDVLLQKLPAVAASSAGDGSGDGSGGDGSGGGSGSGTVSGTPGGGTGSGIPGTGTGSGSPGGTRTGTGSTGSSGIPSRTGSTGTSIGATTPSSGSSQTTTQPASASQLAADQAAIDSAKAQRNVAQQNLAAATLTSPITGIVSNVGFTAGSSSSGESITVLGTGKKTIAIDVPLSEIGLVKVGQSATVAVDGFTGPLHGNVTKIGMLSSTSGSLTTFPVTVTLTDSDRRLHDGAGADVTITTGRAKNALLVPNSAITTVGTRHVVSLVQAGRTTTAQVTVGLAGTDTSQVTSGLTVGDDVQLADPGKALPSSATTGSNSSFGGSGRFPGFFSGGNPGSPNVTHGGQ